MITSRKTQQEVRMQLDKLDLELLRRVIREELEAHEKRKAVASSYPGYWYLHAKPGNKWDIG